MKTGKKDISINIKKNPRASVEIVFNITYLLTIFLSAIFLYKTAGPGSVRFKFAMMAFLLGGGDSFHLIPRILSILDRGKKDFRKSLGIGKCIASITMTIFYLFLWEIGRVYYDFNVNTSLSIIVYSLAIIRILLCLFPKNQWTIKEPSPKWGFIRNVPFLIQGIIVMVLFLIGRIAGGGLSYMWLAIAISFICYMPVVIWAHKKPIVGMLMLPKSCAYVAIVLMGFSVF